MKNLLLLFFFSSSTIFPQNSDEYIKTTGIVKDIRKNSKFHISKNRIYLGEINADVEYVTSKGDTIRGSVRLSSIPQFGTGKKAGDKIEIMYRSANPYLLYTKSGGFIERYGLYILIGLGVVASLYYIRKATK